MAKRFKYQQKIPRKKVREMIRRGWSVRQDLQNKEAYTPIVGWILVDPDGETVSPEPRRYASEAWDDLWSDE